MKKLLCVLLIFCLAGCSGAENPEKTEINIEKIESESSRDSKSENTASEEGVFCSFGELAGYLAENPELCGYFSDEGGRIRLFVPENLPEKYKLNSIKIHGSYITYHYENTENPAEFFKLEWAFKVTDAEKFLENSLNFSSSEIAEKPGSFVSAVYSAETGEREAFKIIWAEDGFCFSATAAEEILESFKNGMDFVKQEVYN